MSTVTREIEAAAIYDDALTWSAGRERTWQIAAKRALDIVVVSIALIVLAVPMLLLAVVIRLESEGPALLRQIRVKRYGETFVFHKFRSMHDRAHERRDELAGDNEHRGPIFKIRFDPRRTRLGAFLRRSSIDELPNLFDVLRGDMSLVGPRPPLPDEVADYDAWQLRRLGVKPGMTGLWQVEGRSLLSFDEMVRLDIEYIETWSLWKDLVILVRTIPAVVRARGAF